MGEKKSKALAMELVDDLLKDQEGELPSNDQTVATTMATKPVVADEQPQSKDQSTEVSIRVDDKTVDLGSIEITPGASQGPAVTTDANPAVAAENDGAATKTIAASTASVPQNVPSAKKSAELPSEDRVRASVGRFGALRTTGTPTTTEAALAQSENLRIAQTRILELEQELERLRLQNEELGAAGETLRRRADELLAENQKRESDMNFTQSRFEQERSILQATKEALQRDLEITRRKNEELELRISTNIQKIRVRERELENRLELVKMEGTALIRNKDEIILELKRQIDTLNLELNNFRAKNQELNRLTNDKQEMLRRTVKTLRLALSMLEGEEEPRQNQPSQRKAK